MTEAHRTACPPVPPALVVLTPDRMAAAVATGARPSGTPAEAVTVRLHREDAEVLYATVGTWLGEAHDAAAVSALVALGVQLCRQLTRVSSPRPVTPRA